MAGYAQVLEWDDREVQEMLRQMIDHAQDMSEPMDDFRGYLLSETMERFEKEQDPQGQPWTQLSPVTEELRARAGKSGKTLQVDGLLKNSIQGFAGADSAGILVDGSDLEYAAIHNFGGMAGRNHKVEIPQRQFAGLNDDDIAEFETIVTDWVLLKGGRR